MDRRMYLEAVEAQLTRLTPSEREAVRRELDAHIEDRIETLRALGCDEAEADERAAEAMGDPVETGREIAKLYSAFWLWARRLATAPLIVLFLWSLLGVPAWIYSVRNNLTARTDPFRHESPGTELTRLDVRMSVGDDVVYLYGVEGYEPGRGGAVRLHLCSYDRLPFGVDGSALGFLSFTVDGRPQPTLARGGLWTDGAAYMTYTVELLPGDHVLIMRYERFGEAIEREIKLTEVGI